MNTNKHIANSMEILSTTDYKLFKTIKSNRCVVETHVKNLMKAITKRNLLHLRPLVVDKNMIIFDGQHRLEAAERLGIAVYYLVDNNITREDIAALNINQKNWSMYDFLQYYRIEGYDAYDKVSKMLADYPRLRVNTAMMLISNSYGHPMDGFKEGSIDVGNYKNGIAMAEMCSDYFNYFNHAYDRNFLRAIRSIVVEGIYNHVHMKAKLDKYSYKLGGKISAVEYKDMIELIYNMDEPKFMKLIPDKRLKNPYIKENVDIKGAN